MIRQFLSRYQCDWKHIALLAALLIIISLYLADTVMASQKAENLMMILPASVVGVAICLWQMARSIRLREHSTDTTRKSAHQLCDSESVVPAEAAGSPIRKWLFKFRTPLFMTLLGLYLIGLIYVAFDLSTFLFIWLSLVLQGERRTILAFFYALIFAVAVTWCLQLMVPFQFDTVFF